MKKTIPPKPKQSLDSIEQNVQHERYRNYAINTVRHASFKKWQLAETIIRNVESKKAHLADFPYLSMPVCLIEINRVQEIYTIRP
jgi:hypothetical protein